MTTYADQSEGFSLIESAIVLGIVGLVLGGIWLAAATVSENHKVSKMTEGLLVLIEKTRRINTGFSPNSIAGAAAVGDPVSILEAMSSAGAVRPDVFPLCDFPSEVCYGLWNTTSSDASGLRLYVIKRAAGSSGEYYIQLWMPVSACIKVGRMLSRINFKSYNISRVIMDPQVFLDGPDLTLSSLSLRCAMDPAFQIYFNP